MSFNCKLNKKYKDALKLTNQSVSLQDICDYYNYSSIQWMLNLHTEAWWQSQYSNEIDAAAAEEAEKK